MTTDPRTGRPAPVDLMFGGDEAEALFESWLADADTTPPSPVRVVVIPAPPCEGGPPGDGGDASSPASWRPPATRAPQRRPR